MKPINIGGIELATPGDVAVGGIAYATGFAVDAFFFSGGVTSGATGGACTAGALGVKYSIQALYKKNDKGKDRSNDKEQPNN